MGWTCDERVPDNSLKWQRLDDCRRRAAVGAAGDARRTAAGTAALLSAGQDIDGLVMHMMPSWYCTLKRGFVLARCREQLVQGALMAQSRVQLAVPPTPGARW